MPKDQSWESCRYAVAAGAGDMEHELSQHGLHELYACEHAPILNLAYPREHIKSGDKLIEVAKLHRIIIADELTGNIVTQLLANAKKATLACRHCKYYEMA